MSNPQTEILPLSGQRQNSESDNAVIACNDWLRMGSGRSLPKLLEKYTNSYHTEPPTTALQTLKVWSMKFEWTGRAKTYDSSWEERKNAERESVMNYGLSLDYERVQKLMRLADFLEQQIFEKGEGGIFHNVWLPDVKQIGAGEFAERVDIERFNAAILSEYRAVLDDISKEVGGRVKKQEVTGANGGAITFKFEWADTHDNSGHAADND